MALAPADFYAYSRATGVPVPENPEERAALAPEVLEFRRNQLKSAQPTGVDPLSVGIGLGLAAAGVGAGALGLSSFLKGRKTATAASVPTNRQDIERVQNINLGATVPSQGTTSVSPSKVATTAAIPQATVDLSGAAPQERMVRRHGRMVPASSVKRSAAPKRPSSIDLDFLDDPEFQKQLELEEAEAYSASEEAQQEMRRATRAVQGVESKEKAQAKNILLELRRNQEAAAVKPSTVDLTTLQQEQQPNVVAQQNLANDTGLDQTVQNIDAISQRDIDNVRAGGFVSAEDVPTDPTVAELRVNPNESVVSQLNKRKALRQQALNEARQTLGIETEDAPLPEGFEVEMTPGEKAGTLAQEALREVKDRKQRVGPAPISQGYKEALFDVTQGGLLVLKPEIIAKNLGDPNVFPESLSQELRNSIKTSSSIDALTKGNLSKIEISDPAVLRRATQHVMQNLLAEDDANTVKDYLLSGGELQTTKTKGFGYTGTRSMSTEVVTITGPKGEEKISVSGPRGAARYTRSDLEPIYFDEDTGALIRKSDIGATQSSEGQSGSGIGEEIGQAVGFVPREKIEKFVVSPGGQLLDVDESDTRYKGQGTGYAVGGLKELGSTGTKQVSPEVWQAIREKRKELGLKPTETTPEIESMLERARSVDADLSVQELPLFKNAYDAADAGVLSVSSKGSPYLKVNSLMLKANPGLENYVDQNYGTLYKNPLTGQNFTSEYDALNTYNRLANNLNAKLIRPAEMRVDALAGGENLNVQLSRAGNKPVFTQLNPNLVVDQVVRRSPQGDTITDDVTLAQAIRNQLLNPHLKDKTGAVLRDPNTKLPLKGSSLIQEQRVTNEDGTPGATYYTQARYQVPESMTYLDTSTGERKPQALGLGDSNLPLATNPKEGSKNHYLFLQGVNNALEEITGQRVKVIDDALLLAKQPGAQFLGGPSKNPVLREALTIANTLAQTSEKSRVRMSSVDDEGLGERYGLGARTSERPQRNVPSRQATFSVPTQQVTQTQMRDPNTGNIKNVTQLVDTNQTRNVQVPPEVIGGKRLAAVLVDYRERSGQPMRRQDFLSMANDIAVQENANVQEVIKQAAVASRGAGQQAVTGRLMSQGRRALAAMDRPSPAEEVAQTIAEYDFGETVGSDIERAVQGPEGPLDVDMELTARQAQRAKVEPPGATETFNVDDQMLSNLMGRLRAQAGRRAGKRRSR